MQLAFSSPKMSELLNIDTRNIFQTYQFQTPEVVGFFSLDKDRKQHFNADNLRYLRKDREEILPLKLNLGFDVFEELPPVLENVEKLGTLIGWLIVNNYLRQIADAQSTRKTFISFRGLLSLLLKTPYEKQEDWLICAIKVKNLVFLCAFFTDRKKAQIQRGTTKREKQFQYWGRKFEHYMLAVRPDEKSDINELVNAGAEFCLMYKSILNSKHNLLFGAEVDGVISDEVIPNQISVDLLNEARFVELKTSRLNTVHGAHASFCRFKSLKWWAQSYLAGIKRIICGERYDDGTLVNLKEFRVGDLPRLGDGFWNPKVSMKFLDDFLSFVENILDREPDFITWKFYWRPHETIVTGQKVTDPEELKAYNVLPEEFRKECLNCFK